MTSHLSPTHPAQSVSVRDAEAQRLGRCVAAGMDSGLDAGDEEEANLFYVAALLLQSTHPAVAQRLMLSAERYLTGHALSRLPVEDAVRRGWVPPLPRMRSMLTVHLANSKNG